MDLTTALTLLNGEIVSRRPDLEQVVSEGSAADLMSDVLTYSSPGSLLLTGLTNPQVVRTAEMAGIRAIVFVRGKHPPAATIDLAEETGILLLRTCCTMYEACGRLYAGGLRGRGPCESYGPPE